MADESKSPKKGSITEEDAAALLERYSVETLLTLLQEVERVAGDKIDWDELVKNTATGISSAREYQMLWRHLAYGNMLEDQIDSDAEPMDDDSDLEFDMKASPAATNEESALAEACVKVLIASGSNNSNPPADSTIDAPLAINVRSSKASTASSDSSLLADAIQGHNVIIPVSVQKLTGGLTPSRRDWSKEEDMKLTASVQKYGEPDWANIAEGDFENGRSASELSKRWTKLTKKLHSSNEGSSSQLSEPKLAAAHGSLPMDNTLNVANEINTDSAKAAAIGAGSHMGASTEGSSLNDAARSQNVVRLKAAADYVIRKYRARKYQLPGNVRSIRRGLAKAPISSYSAPVHSAARAVQPNPVEAAPVLSVSSEKTNSTASIPSESEESGYQASISSSDPENHPLDAHVAMQISEDEELGDEDVEATSSNSIAPTEDDEE
ncbi:uncharacterized protein LOC142545244 isoform X2 [Primulina tabacum]|uniref:uncharacterized protein LOC142545244 isoform X2 n=1 Tax=Primulina tabacum TaxID=48773 RepID=UPI003F5A456F